jgi:rhodanese-related sulfurtransferase
MKKSVYRLLVLVFGAITFGIIYNQLYPNGIKWQLYFPASIFGSENEIAIISADSALFFFQQGRAGFIDCRSKEDFELDHIVSAIHIPLNLLWNDIQPDLPSSKNIWILYDYEGSLDELSLASSNLTKNGITDVRVLFGGYVSWLEKNYPTELGEYF